MPSTLPPAARAVDRAKQTAQAAVNAAAEAAATERLAQLATTLAQELATRHAAEARLLEREAELTTFATMAAHDLRAPLRAVAGFTHGGTITATDNLGGGSVFRFTLPNAS